jgi:hypothetical protein
MLSVNLVDYDQVRSGQKDNYPPKGKLRKVMEGIRFDGRVFPHLKEGFPPIAVLV